MSGRPHRAAVVLVTLGVGSLVACRPSKRGRAYSPPAPPVVIFRNQSLYEAAVYAVSQGGAANRIGTVQPGRTETIRVRTGAIGSGSVTFFARLLASSARPSSGPLTLLPGDTLAITLPPDARFLSALPPNR